MSVCARTGLFSAGFARWMAPGRSGGLARVACLGNKADISELDVLECLGRDPDTTVIALHAENTVDGRALVELLREITLRKPVVALKPGRTEAGREAALSHTGAMAGSHEVFMGALAQGGAIGVDGFEQMFDYTAAFACCPPPAGNRIGVASVTGAGCSLSADATDACGLEVPSLSDECSRKANEGVPEWAWYRNPADIWSAIAVNGNAGAYYKVLRAMAEQEDIDMLVAVFTITPEFEFDAGEVMGRLREEFPGKPLLACVLWGGADESRRWVASLESARVPAYPSIERAVSAAGALWRHSRRLRTVGAA